MPLQVSVARGVPAQPGPGDGLAGLPWPVSDVSRSRRLRAYAAISRLSAWYLPRAGLLVDGPRQGALPCCQCSEPEHVSSDG